MKLASTTQLTLALLAALSVNDAQARIEPACLAAIKGAYLTDTSGVGPSGSAGMLLISSDALVHYTDSHQDGNNGAFPPFTDANGIVTECEERRNGMHAFKAYVIDFNLKALVGGVSQAVTDPGMARLEYAGTIDRNGNLAATFTLVVGLIPANGPTAAGTSFNGPFQGTRLR
jgi:hypothetical protein